MCARFYSTGVVCIGQGSGWGMVGVGRLLLGAVKLYRGYGITPFEIDKFFQLTTNY